jgi:predicted aspartyl protease
MIWAALLLGFLADPAHAGCALKEVAALPLRQSGGLYALSARINGHDASLAVATGSYQTTINLASAKHLGLDMHLSDDQVYGVGGMRRDHFASLDRMRVGNIVAENTRLRGLDLWPEGTRDGLDGTFGMNFMVGYDLDFDLPGNALLIYKPEGLCVSAAVALSPPLYSGPLAYGSDVGQIAIDLMIDNTHLRAVPDSGVPRTEISRSAALRAGIDVRPLSAPDHAVEAGFGPYPVAYMDHVFGSMQIGDLAFRNTAVRVIDAESAFYKTEDSFNLSHRGAGGEDVVLGADFMKKVHVWVSHSSGHLILQYPPRPSDLPK